VKTRTELGALLATGALVAAVAWIRLVDSFKRHFFLTETHPQQIVRQEALRKLQRPTRQFPPECLYTQAHPRPSRLASWGVR
jgi:hypothetical protein